MQAMMVLRYEGKFCKALSMDIKTHQQACWNFMQPILGLRETRFNNTSDSKSENDQEQGKVCNLPWAKEK